MSQDNEASRMKVCGSCGGVIGRECFDTQQCAEITASMASDNYRTLVDELVCLIDELEEDVQASLDANKEGAKDKLAREHLRKCGKQFISIRASFLTSLLDIAAKAKGAAS